MNPVLAKLNPQWFAEIKEIDESIFVDTNELFRKSRAELKELREKMQQMVPIIQSSNNAFARFRFSSQLQMLDTWENWLDYPTHISVDAVQGYKFFQWIKTVKGDVPITTDLLDQAYARLKAPEPIPEPEVAPIIVKQPQSISVAALEPAVFEVEVQGSKPMEFQWMINVQEIPGEHAKRARYQTTTSEYNDGALFCCRISNKFGQIVSYPARLLMVK